MRSLVLALLPGFLLLGGCSRGYQPIDYGKDPCAHCKMTIVDDRFAAEFVSEKGKAFKFDDILCMNQFLAEQGAEKNSLLFVEDYLRSADGAIDAKAAVYLQHEFFSSPMNGDYAAFSSENDAKQFRDSLNVPLRKWEDLQTP